LFVACLLAVPCGLMAEEEQVEKLRVAVFPVGGEAGQELREKVAFAIRQKLDRTNLYEVIDGYTMAELAAEHEGTINFDTPPAPMRLLGSYEEADLVAWGDLSGTLLRMKVLDLRAPDTIPEFVEFSITRPQELRFATEEVVEKFPGVLEHEYISEEAVQDDEQSRELWAKNPNLVTNATFGTGEEWWALYRQDKWNPQRKTTPPGEDEVVIYSDAGEDVLAMNLSRWCAENPGMSVISKEFKIEPKTRYRIKFRYKSDAPTIRPFVKGYTMGKNLEGVDALREVYRRQVPPKGATNGQWVEVVCDLNPQHVHFPVQYLKVSLYAYLSPGTVMWDDVEVKAVGAPTRIAKDVAIKKPSKAALERAAAATQPSTHPATKP